MRLPTIECKYSCKACALHRIPVQVQARLSEDVGKWLEKVATPALVADHERRSPHCHPKAFTEVMIPMPDGTQKIGGPIEN